MTRDRLILLLRRRGVKAIRVIDEAMERGLTSEADSRDLRNALQAAKLILQALEVIGGDAVSLNLNVNLGSATVIDVATAHPESLPEYLRVTARDEARKRGLPLPPLCQHGEATDVIATPVP